jgi:hypothetical protein
VFPVHHKASSSAKDYTAAHEEAAVLYSKEMKHNEKNRMFVQQDHIIPSFDLYSEAVITQQIIMVFDPRSHFSNTLPACSWAKLNSCFMRILNFSLSYLL